MTKKKEIYKDVKGYEGYYLISNFGNVINSNTNKLLKGFIYRNEKRIVLSKDSVHKTFALKRLVVMNFKSDIQTKDVILNKDGNILNNNIENLIISSRRDVSFLRFKKTRKLDIGVCKVKNRFQSKICINGKLIRLGSFKTYEEAKKEYENVFNLLNENSPFLNQYINKA